MDVSTFTVTPSTGDVYATDFFFVDTVTDNVKSRVWSLGDGTYKYDVSNFTHTYNYPGGYVITLTRFMTDGETTVESQSVIAEYVYRDSISFVQIPDKYADPGGITTDPFKIVVTTAQTDVPLTVNLYAANSNSIPYEYVPSKWQFLTPTWRFLDNAGNFVTALSVEPVKLFKNDRVVGLSGEKEFYFVDDTSTGDPTINCPLLLAATLQTSAFNFPQDGYFFPYPSYSNSVVAQAVITWQINDLKPSYLRVTGNYINDIYPRKWTNVKIPITITGHSSREDRIPGSGETESNIIFSYPATNQLGLSSEIVVTMPGIPSSYYTVDEAPLYFKALTPDGFKTGGYIFTTVTPLSPMDSATIAVSGVVYENGDWTKEEFPYPSGFAPNPFIWFSNPERSSINKVILTPYPDNCETINYYKQNGILIDGQIKVYSVPTLTSGTSFNYSMSGFAGIYGIAIDPRKFDIIATDNEFDRLYKFSTSGELLCSVEFSNFGDYSPLSGAYTPANVVIDKNYNIYTSLYNSVSVLKFDKELTRTATYIPTGTNLFLEDNSDYLVKPPVVETDRDNNLWVTYAHPLCSLIVKYNTTTGAVLKQIQLPTYTLPNSLAITLQNNVWVANSYNSVNNNVANQLLSSSIQLYNTSTGTLMSSISGFIRPDNIAMDRGNNLWFTHGLRNFGLITKTGERYSWNIDTTGYVSQLPLLSTSSVSAIDISEVMNNEDLVGLSVDVYNRVWLLDSYTNKTYVFSADPMIDPTKVRAISIRPKSTIGFKLDDTNSFTVTMSDTIYQSIQAAGDWTGNKWYQKYVYANTLSAVQVSGVSTPFTVYDFQNNFQIQRKNEDFNTASYLKSLALPEIMSSNTMLFDQFFAAAVGTAAPSAYEDIGQNIYERIANFVFNHADIDTCNIPQLLSFAKETSIIANTYGDTYPAEIQKYLDIASVPKNKLWGFKTPVPLSAQSIGQQLDISTAYISAGTKMYVRNKFDSSLTIVDIPKYNLSATYYPLSSFEGYGLAQPVIQNYLFYEYSPVYSETFIEGIIDWENPYTTLSPYASTTEEWYGEEGAIENVFNYLLTKNLVVK